MRSRLPLVVPLLLACGGCPSVRDLGGPPPDLSPGERQRVDGQVRAAVDEGEWQAAWNQAVDAGLPRERLEVIALGALGARKRAGEVMVERLLEEHGALGPAALEEARRLRDRAAEEGDWRRAARIEVLTATDGPAFLGAWRLYDRAPPDEAPGVLEVILEARERSGRDDG